MDTGVHRRRRSRDADGDSGAAVAEVVMVSVLLMILVGMVVQVGLVLHARNVLAAAAAEGARHGANAAVDSGSASEFAQQVAGKALSSTVVDGLTFSTSTETGPGGVVVITVSVDGPIPLRVGTAGFTVHTKGAAVKEPG